MPKLLELGIAQYNARIFELRRLGFRIENRSEVAPQTGARHSWFRLVSHPASETAGGNTQSAAAGSDWYERAHGPRPANLPAKPESDLPLFGEAPQ